MADIKGTTTIHGNTGLLMVDGNIIGRVKNINVTLDGSMDEFYEIGSAWVQDLEPINRKSLVEIERGVIDYELLAYAVGAHAQLNVDGDTSFNENVSSGEENTQYNLIIDENESMVLSLAGGNTPIITSPFVFDVVLMANKVISSSETRYFTVTVRDCKISRFAISAPTSGYWTGSISLTGKQIALGGVTHSIS